MPNNTNADISTPNPQEILLDELDESPPTEPYSVDELGELSISGSTPATTSDDNVLDNAHDVGLYTDANEEEPAELDISEQFAQAEKLHKEN
jgi:hypothetical protein